MIFGPVSFCDVVGQLRTSSLLLPIFSLPSHAAEIHAVEIHSLERSSIHSKVEIDR